MNSPGSSKADHYSDEHRWARNVLEVPPDVDGERLHGYLLRHLADEDFSLSSESREALLALARSDSDSDIHACQDEFIAFREQNLTKELDEFASIFFSLTSDERNRRWQLLQDKPDLTHPQRMRLLELEPAISLNTEQLSESTTPRLPELAELVCDLFVLTPPARAIQWRQHRERIQPDIDEWSRAAKTLKADHSEIAEMLPGIVDELIALNPLTQKQVQKNIIRLQASGIRQAKQDEKNADSGDAGFPSWIIIVFSLAAGVVIAFLNKSDNPDEHSPGRSPEYYQNRSPDIPEFQLPTDSAIRRLLEEHSKRNEFGKRPTAYPSSGKKPSRNSDAELKTLEDLEATMILIGASQKARDDLKRRIRELNLNRKQAEDARKTSAKPVTKSGKKTVSSPKSGTGKSP